MSWRRPVHCLDANTAKVLEMSMLRFLFILAHHADITCDVEGLQLASQYAILAFL